MAFTSVIRGLCAGNVGLIRGSQVSLLSFSVKWLRFDFFSPGQAFHGIIEIWKHNLKHLFRSNLLIIFIRLKYYPHLFSLKIGIKADLW